MARYKQNDDDFTRRPPGDKAGTSLGAIIVVVVLVGGAGAANYFLMQKTKAKQEEVRAAYEQQLSKLQEDSQLKIEKAMMMAREEAESAMQDKVDGLEGQLADIEAAMPMFEGYKREAIVARAEKEELQQHFDGLAAQTRSLENQLKEAMEATEKAKYSDALAAVKQREDALIEQLKKSQLQIRDQKETMRQQAAQIKALEAKVKQLEGAPAQ